MRKEDELYGYDLRDVPLEGKQDYSGDSFLVRMVPVLIVLVVIGLVLVIGGGS